MENNFAVGKKSKGRRIFFCLLFLAFISVFLSQSVGFVSADAATEIPSGSNEETWIRWSDTVVEKLSAASKRYGAGERGEALALVLDAYVNGYAASGFRAQIAADLPTDAAALDGKFDALIAAMEGGSADAKDIKDKIDEINNRLYIVSSGLDRLHPREKKKTSDFNTWSEVAAAMNDLLDGAYNKYAVGDRDGAWSDVNDAYFKFYEKEGFEKNTMIRISGEHASKVEYLIGDIKKKIKNNDGKEVIKGMIDELKTALTEDAAALDGSSNNPFAAFSASLLIIVREGAEAILIVGAIIAYLKKSGNAKKVKMIYIGSGAAVIASVLMAVIFMYVTSLTGENQELIEGITMLIAVAVMFYVSNWIFSKSETAAWEGYIKKRVNTSIQRGSAFSLAFTAFLAVFREGAEIILFYQALLAGDNTNIGMIWLGLGVGVVILAGIYLLIRFLSIKVPLKPFFRATSVLMFLMVVSFMGNAVKEFQEGNYVSVTSIKGMFTFDILGIYPTYETLIPQLLLLLISAAAIIFQIFRLRKLKSAARIAASADGGENPAAPDAESAGDNTAENTSFDKESEVTDANISIPDRESGTEEHIE